MYLTAILKAHNPPIGSASFLTRIKKYYQDIETMLIMTASFGSIKAPLILQYRS